MPVPMVIPGPNVMLIVVLPECWAAEEPESTHLGWVVSVLVFVELS